MSSGEKYQTTLSRVILSSVILFVILVMVAAVSLSVGSVSISPGDIFYLIFYPSSVSDTVKDIIYDIRLPRVILAALTGAGLALSGAIFQALLKNPLAEPYILGVSGGGALGAMISAVLGLSFLWLHTFSFAGSLIVVITVFIIGTRMGEIEQTYLIISGIMISAFISSLIFLLVTFYDQSFRMAIFWLLGNLSFANSNMIMIIFPFFIITLIMAGIFSHSYNLLSIDEETAQQFGINTKVVKNVSYFITSLLVSVIVANVGIIGFVGFLIPHLCRLIFGTDNKILIPSATISGAVFLLISDMISRTVYPPMEIPIGAITAILGSPVFIMIMRRKMR